MNNNKTLHFFVETETQNSTKTRRLLVVLSIDLVTYMSIREVWVKNCWSDATAAKNWKLKFLPMFFPRQKLEMFEILEFALVRPGPRVYEFSN